jgi:hypothetical protein
MKLLQKLVFFSSLLLKGGTESHVGSDVRPAMLMQMEVAISISL